MMFLFDKREAGNAIVNTQSKNALAIFSVSNVPTGVTWLSQLPGRISKLPQPGDPYWCFAY